MLKITKKQNVSRLIFAAGFLAAVLLNCQPDIKYVEKDPSGLNGESAPPRLAILNINDASGNQVLAFSKSDGGSGSVPVTFNPDANYYSVIFDENTPAEVFIEAKPFEDMADIITINCITAPQFKVTPEDGLFVVINVLNKVTLMQSTYTVQFSRVPLPPAQISEIALSAGVLLDSGGWKPNSFAPAAGYPGHIHTVQLPYGLRKVSIWPRSNDAGAFFAYSPSMPVELLPEGDVFKAELRIETTAPGKSPSVYAIEIIEGAAETSELVGLTLSAGVITTDAGGVAIFDPRPSHSIQYITVPHGTQQLVVAAVKRHFADKITWQADEYMAAKVFNAAANGSLDTTSFTLTVEEGVKAGVGYTPRVYDFTIREAAGSDQASLAEVDGLVVSGGTLYTRNSETGENSTPGYDAGVSVYNIQFTNGDTGITLTAQTENGSTFTVSGGGADVTVASPASVPSASKTITYPTPRANDPPIKILVAGSTGVLAREYTVYLKKHPIPPARLSGITVVGGELADAFSDSVTNYQLNVPATSSSVIVTGLTETQPDDTELSVSYTPANFLSGGGLATDSTISIKVSGGADWAETTYTLTVNKLDSRPARLSQLGVNGSYLIGTAESPGTTDHPFSYGPTTDPALPIIDFSENTVQVPFVWAVADSGVTVSYAVNGGDWIENDPDGFNLTLSASQSHLVLIKVFSPDEGIAIYRVSVSMAGNLQAQLASLGIDPATGTLEPPDFNAAVYVYTLTMPNGTSGSIAFTPTRTAASAGAAIRRSINDDDYENVSSNFTVPVPDVGTTTRLVIQAAPQNGSAFNSYTVLIRQAGTAANTLQSLSVSSPMGGEGAWAGVSFGLDDLDDDNELARLVQVPNWVTAVTISATGPLTSTVSAQPVYTDANSDPHCLRIEDIQLDVFVPKTIAITVTAQNGAPRTYTLTLMRSLLAALDGLTVQDGFALRQNLTGDAAFLSTVQDYNVIVAPETTEVIFTPELTVDARAYSYRDTPLGLFTNISGSTISVTGLADGLTQLVIRVTLLVDNTYEEYNVDIFKPIATGGTITYFVDGSDIDEIHTFNYTGGNQTFAFRNGVDSGSILGTNILLVAGGGGGGGGSGGDAGGGGGAGGLITLLGGRFVDTYTVTVGSGGAGGTAGGGSIGRGSQGGNSSFFWDGGNYTVNGGGGGGGAGGNAATSAGGDGGSGGGGGAGDGSMQGNAGSTIYISGVGGQGHNGAAGSNDRPGGGGGGAGSVGSITAGGDGISVTISGTACMYAVGGDGASGNGTQTTSQGATQTAYGSGGGGGMYNTAGSPGQHGIVIVRFTLPSATDP